jgi:hypothetical protein
MCPLISKLIIFDLAVVITQGYLLGTGLEPVARYVRLRRRRCPSGVRSAHCHPESVGTVSPHPLGSRPVIAPCVNIAKISSIFLQYASGQNLSLTNFGCPARTRTWKPRSKFSCVTITLRGNIRIAGDV